MKTFWVRPAIMRDLAAHTFDAILAGHMNLSEMI